VGIANLANLNTIYANCSALLRPVDLANTLGNAFTQERCGMCTSRAVDLASSGTSSDFTADDAEVEKPQRTQRKT
jgi:hypothetical protein